MVRTSMEIETLEGRQLLSASPLSYSLLSDIDTGSASSLPEQFQSVNGKVLFLAYDKTRGQMLWSTDGTAGGTTMVADINPNPQSGMYEGYGQPSVVIGNEMYFAGTDYAHGTELWKTDGTTAGTQLVGDLNPGLDSSTFSAFTNFNGKLAFQANGQLWVSNGTPQGTLSLGSYAPAGNGGTTDRMSVLGSNLYFFRYGSPNATGHDTGELWTTDGTVAGTHEVIDISPGSDGRDNINSTPSDLITIGNELYFAADDGTHGWELYRSDGTAGGTAIVADLAPTPAAIDGQAAPYDGSYPTDLTDVNGTLYFAAAPDGQTSQLYKLDSSGNPVALGSVNPQNLTAAGSSVFFTATDATHGRELWTSDGTAAGTTLVTDINAGANDSGISNITAIGSSVVFTADNGTAGPELWESDGTSAGTSLIASSNQSPTGSSPGDYTMLNGKLIFEASSNADGEEPFAIDLSSSGVDPITTPITSTPVTSTPVTTTSTGTSDDAPSVQLMSTAKGEIDLRFSEDVSASFGRGTFTLTNLDTGLRVDPSTIRVTYNHKTNTARITFKNKAGNVLGTGHFRLRIAAAKVLDADGNAMAGSASYGFTIRKKTK